MDMQQMMAAMALQGLATVPQVPPIPQMQVGVHPGMMSMSPLQQNPMAMKGQVGKGMMPGKMGSAGPAAGGNKGEAMQMLARMMKGKGKTGPATTGVKGKGKVSNKIAMGEPAFVGRVRTYNAEKNNGLISCPECWAICRQEVYVYKTVLESCRATVGDTVAFMVHWNQRGQPQASGFPEILRLYNAQGDMALKGIFKWGPGEQFGFIENAQVQEFFGRDTYVRKELADTLNPGHPVAFNIKLNKEFQPCASEAVICDESWEAMPGDLSMSREDPTVPPAWEELKTKTQGMKSTPTGEHLTGIIKAYNEKNGWGFLTSEELHQRFGADVFVHQKELVNCPNKVAGMVVHFELGMTEDGKPQALNVRPGGDQVVEPASKRMKLDAGLGAPGMGDFNL